MKRVVITGVGAISPLGHDWACVHARLREERNVVQHLADWDKYKGLNTRLAVPAAPFTLPPEYNDTDHHLANFINSVRTRTQPVEDAVFGLRAAGPALLCNLSLKEKRAIGWDPVGMRVV